MDLAYPFKNEELCGLEKLLSNVFTGQAWGPNLDP